MRCTYLLLVALSMQLVAHGEKALDQDLSHFISKTKAELARSFFVPKTVDKEVAKVNLTVEKHAEINLAGAGSSGAFFRRSKENYVVGNGSHIFQLRKKHPDDGSGQKYFLQSVQQFSTEEGAILFEQTEWKNILFLTVCYRGNYCHAFMSHPARSITSQQRLTVRSTPTDLQFFVDDGDLFLLVAGDPCKIYRWTGTYFDEHEELDTSGATAAATFSDAGATVIVVARNLPAKQVYSKVFVRKNRKTELMQMLPSSGGASDVAAFSLDSGNETLNFIFLLSNLEESVVFWWSGREFFLWKRVPDAVGQGRIYVRRLASQLFLLLARQDELRVYHPTAMTFDLIHVIKLDRNIVDVDVREETDGPPMLLLLESSDSQSVLTVSVLSVDVNRVPTAGNRVAVDSVLQCLLQLENLMQIREAQLNESVLLSDEIGKQSQVIELKNLSAAKVELKSFTVNELKVNPLGEKLEATPTEIRKKLEKLKAESDSLLAKLEATQKQVRYRFYGDIIVDRMKASSVHANKFSDRAFDLSNIISVTKDQTLSGAIHLKTLSAGSLTVPSIGGVYVKDVLLRKKPLQAITAEHTVHSVKAKNVIFGRLGKLNGTLFSGTRRFDDAPRKTVSGRKTFARMGIAHLQVDFINDEPADQWLAKLLPTPRDFGPQEEALNFTDLAVADLIVDNINGMTWQDYLAAWKGSGRKENRPIAESVEAVHLRARKINGIETASLLTKDTHQTVHSTVAVTSAESASVKARAFVGGPRQPDALQTPIDVSEIVFRKIADISGRTVHFDELNKTYWMKSWPQEIDASVTLASHVTVAGLETSRINGRATDDFVASRDVAVEGPVEFEDVTVLGNVAASFDAQRNVNLNKLYESAVKASGESGIRGRIMFMGKVSAERVDLNSLNVFPFGHRHLSTSSGILMVPEAEIVGSVSVKDEVRLNYLNARDFNYTMMKYVRLDERDALQNGNYSSISAKEMHAGRVNGVPSASRLATRGKRSKLRLAVVGDLKAEQLEVATLNNISLNGYLNKVVLRNGTASTIKGRKSFQKVVTVKGNLDGALNGRNLTELEGCALSKLNPQNVTGSYVVDVVNVNNADVEVIDGVFSEDLLFQDGPPAQTIRSDILFTDVAVAGNVQPKIFMGGCDLSMMTGLKVNEIKKLGKLDVKGNVTWNGDRMSAEGISYLYANAMRAHEEQIAEGSITFRGKTSVDKLNTKSNLNRVDLQFIVNDGVYTSITGQEIFRDITFRGKVTANNILIENNIIVDNINGVDILDLGQRLVRNSAETEVRGNKKFLSGFATHRFTAEAVNGARTEPIILCDGGKANGSIHFSATTFSSVKTLKDLDVLNVDDVNLSKLLEERLSKTISGKVGANLRIKDSVSIKGDRGIGRINDLNVGETVPVSGEVDPSSIMGKVEFNNTFSAAEKVQVENVNSRNVTAMRERLVLNTADSVIKGNAIFTEDVEFRGNVHAARGVNGCGSKNLKRMAVPRNLGYAESLVAAKIDTEVDGIANASTSLVKPILFTDLQEISTVDLAISKLEKIKVRYRGDVVEVDVHGMDDGIERCRSHSECRCTVQKNLVISSPIGPRLASHDVFPANFKYFEESLKVEVAVTASASSSASSSDFRCDHTSEAKTANATLSWRRTTKRSSEKWEKKSETEEEEKRNSVVLLGRVSDVKFFTIAHSIFVVTAFHAGSPETKMNGLNVVVYEINVRVEKVKKVQEMDLSGAEALHHFWTPKGVVLVAGNGYDSETSADSVDSAIYRFGDSDNQFRLLRSVKTHGILHIASIAHDSDSFLFLVQKQSWPLLILKYSHEFDNYYFSQKLDAIHSKIKSNFLSAAAFTTARPGYGGDVFMGIVQSDGGFRLFRYKHIEGFVEEVRQEQRNVEMLMPFRSGFRQYLFAGSSASASIIYELTQQGSLP